MAYMGVDAQYFSVALIPQTKTTRRRAGFDAVRSDRRRRRRPTAPQGERQLRQRRPSD